jgi:hypothetical protein
MAASAVITGLVAAGGLISTIIQAADTAQRNKRACKNLARLPSHFEGNKITNGGE